jgi:hypothetical protein
MSLFENQLKTLIATLEAVKEPKSFDMTDWYHQEARIVVDCGYAACICGHQAVANKSEFFDINVNLNYQHQAGEISHFLDDSCCDIFGNSFLVDAVVAGEEDNRFEGAVKSGLFTKTELKHSHLRKENPTIKQAISFIKLALKKVEAVK